MNKKTERTIAIIALGFVGIFTVTFIMFLFDPKMGGGSIAFIALFSGVTGVILFFITRMSQKKNKEIEDAQKESAIPGDGDAAEPGNETEDPENAKKSLTETESVKKEKNDNKK